MSLIIDCHGHFTTAPKALEDWRNKQIAGIQDPSAMPKPSDLKISDDDLREAIETNQLKLMKERGSDLTLFSPRASFMAHHIGDFQVSSTWAAICQGSPRADDVRALLAFMASPETASAKREQGMQPL